MNNYKKEVAMKSIRSLGYLVILLIVGLLPTTPINAFANWWDKFGEPKYGGTMTSVIATTGDTKFDPGLWGGNGRGHFQSLFHRDWTVDRSIEDFRAEFVAPEHIKGGLAESWEKVNPNTYTVHLHKGVMWENKPPMNGRELTAQDVEYTYDRILGTGSGFDKPAMPYGMVLGNIAKVTAIDKYTLTFKLKRGNFYALYDVFDSGFFAIDIIAPELVEQGGLNDWKKAVGYGPWVLTDFIDGVGITYVKNPNFWGYDERYPDKKIPYVDTFKKLAIPERATALSAIRTGKVDIYAMMNTITWQQADTVAEKNPEIMHETWPSPGLYLQLRCDRKPFTDIRVRKALQMAIDLKTIAKTHFGGYVSGDPMMVIYPGFKGYTLPFSEWPDELKAEYTYNPEGAKKLLDEAGYPNGFKTNVVASGTNEDTELLEIIKAYFKDIGVDMEIKLFADLPSKQAFTNAGKHDQMQSSNSIGVAAPPSMGLQRWKPGGQGNQMYNDDPYYKDLIEKALNAATLEEAHRSSVEVEMYGAKQHWAVVTFGSVSPIMWQSWFKGYSGEMIIGGLEREYWARCWINKQ